MKLIGGSNKHGPWPIHHNGGVLEFALWLAVFGWPLFRVGYYFSLRIQPSPPENVPVELLFPEVWIGWGVVVAVAVALSISPVEPSDYGGTDER